MSKLKIEHGASKVRWILLKTKIEESISIDIDLMCDWSQNDRRYIVNQLLRFALVESTDFQQFKAQSQAKPSPKPDNPQPIPASARAEPDVTPKPPSSPVVFNQSQ